MLDNLPQDICVDILTRLPIKAMIRCTTLSKKYQSLIINPEFTHAHICRNTTDNKSQFFLRSSYGRKDERFFFEPKLDAEPLSEFPLPSQLDDANETFDSVGVQVPVKSKNELFSILGSINGVICLSDDYRSNIDVYVLWNPCIKKWLELPTPLITFPIHGPCYLASGFGFDSVRNDYKVVRIMHLCGLLGLFKEPPLVEVYSMNSGYWKIVGAGPPYFIRGPPEDFWTPCFLDGAVHWLGSSVGPAARDMAIVTFNVCSEVCGIIELPECLRFDFVLPLHSFPVGGEEANIVKKDVLEYKGMLAVIKKESKPRTCCIWVMKEYGVVESWTRMFHLDFSDDCWMPWSYGFTNNGEIIVPRHGGDRHRRLTDKVVLLEPTKRLEKFVGGIIGNLYHVATYVESMALFDVGKRDG